MQDAATKIIRYTAKLDFANFSTNELVKDAVARNIEIIGEACNKLPNSYYLKYPEMQWSKIIGMRNRLIHGYFDVDIPMLWNTINQIIPTFSDQIKQLILKEEMT